MTSLLPEPADGADDAGGRLIRHTDPAPFSPEDEAAYQAARAAVFDARDPLAALQAEVAALAARLVALEACLRRSDCSLCRGAGCDGPC